MPAHDVYQFINDQDATTVETLLNRLEFRAGDSTFKQYRDAYLDRLAIPEMAAVLDLGCGSGVLARALARRPGFTAP